MAGRAGGSERVRFEGPAGGLEGLWLPSGDRGLDRGVVLCHPHPLYGGTMETKLVARVARSLGQSGFQTLRFNFRGVGQSDGTFDRGEGERADARAALDYLAERMAGARLAVFGFSFGAMVGLDVGSHDPRIAALVGVAPPVGRLPEGLLGRCPKPTLVVGAGRDSIIGPKALKAWAGAVRSPCELVWFDEADHLFTGRTEAVAERVADFLDRSMTART